ncbi:hypothetical protein PV328_003221 [Microctonus aethiopoides]|uniref:Nuclear condensin complex subunit 3 C-terminal domain-containing protein n=1 Tax=Microctonus aethiopoides TaxID=144406 RepID=A0AA39F7X5_9HYME|nr:hypothetical protein PV328_003221 [Microctonus aethiopoides]
MYAPKIKVVEVMREIFTNVQYNKTCHYKYIKKLKKVYDNAKFEHFCDAFINCLKVPLCVGDRHPHVENVLEFAAKFSVSLYTFNDAEDEPDEDICPFLTKIFEFLIEKNDVKDPAVRFRICHFLNMILNSMGESAFIDDNICDKISNAMMDRLMDRSPKVRTQAVYALHRLQDPLDDQCPVITVFIFHMTKDPSAQVRRAVLNIIAKNQRTLQAVIKRTRDINDSVRKAAYIFISKITVRSLTIKDRESLLEDGLNDHSEVVRKVVREKLLPSWLHHLQGDYMKLLRALDAETASDTAKLALFALFKQTNKNELFQQLPLDPEKKLIPIDKLTAENVLYWRCYVEHLHKESSVELLEDCLPELTKFCDYIRDYETKMSAEEYSQIEMSLRKFILGELFELAKTYDLSDEVGRLNLMQLIQDTLMSDNCSEKIIESIVVHYETIVPNVANRLNALAHVISEIRIPTKQQTIVVEQLSDDEQHERQMKCQRLKIKLIEKQNEIYDVVQKQDFAEAQRLKAEMNEIENEIKNCVIKPTVVQEEEAIEEKNDPQTMIKCLSIMCAMAQVRSVTTLTATLRSLFDNMAYPSLQHPDESVKLLALKAVGICLLLDKELAKEHLMFYFLQFVRDDRDTWIVSLKVMFDLFLRYGLDYFDVIPKDNDNTNDESRKNKTTRLYNNTDDDITDVSLVSVNSDQNNIVKILIGLLENGDQDIRTLATLGFCKLLLHGKLSSTQLVSRLIILLFNPATESDHELRQYLVTFVNTFGSVVHNSHETLGNAFLPTLRTLINAPDDSPLQEIKPVNVARFILDLTSAEHHKPGREDYTVHNNLAFAVLAEALTPDSDIDRDTLFKSLKAMKICCDGPQMKHDMMEAVTKIMADLDENDNSSRAALQQFMAKIEGVHEEAQPQPQPTREISGESDEDEDTTNDSS